MTKKVMSVSSKERTNASRLPVMSAVLILGRVTLKKVWKVVAPRSWDASSKLRLTTSNRAMTVLNTTAVQKTTWPMKTVKSDLGIPIVAKSNRSARPVKMPGNKKGRRMIT